MLKPFSYLINIGVENAASFRQKRNTQLTNFISLGLAASLLLILIFRFITGSMEMWLLVTLGSEVILFLGMIALNKAGAISVSRLLICWAPALVVMIDFKILITHIPTPEVSHYVGFRLFQVGFSFIPFLVYNLSEKWRMALAVSVPVLCTVFFDSILELLGVGYSASGLSENSYYYNNVRTVITLALISAAFIFLKKILEKQEMENEDLIRELAEKNIIIKKNAERELKKAYERLSYHINNTPLAVIERDKEFKITFWNKRAEELFGWSSEEVAGRKPPDFLVESQDLPYATQTMNHVLEQKKDSNFMEIRTLTKNGTVRNCLWFYSFLRDEHGDLETVLSFVSDITEERKANHALAERVKELRTLYNVSQLLTSMEKSMYDIFEELPALLPSGWQYPEVCAARLIVFDRIYQTENYCEPALRQSADIRIDNKTIGILEVVYIAGSSGNAFGSFLKEEHNLLTTIAQMLQVYIERKIEEDEVLKAQANLSSTINNTEIIIWSVDQSFNMITCNQAFQKFVSEVLNVTTTGNKDFHSFPEWMSEKWRERYKRVLTGEILTIEETTAGLEFKYSLSPIIDNANVIGVTVFADNITDEKRQSRELAEANRKISELKVMALRSVMNPHFIFNVLSSIQFFITRNDELNAINYLTSFSKLMRTVLTRSVADSVTLQEEIELLKEYVHLEKLRFEDKFHFSVDCDETLDTESIRLPSLLIQPYVENAILHGLYGKDGNGSLQIKVRKEDQFLIFEIRDDGIGREAASRLRQKSEIKKESMGTQLTEERLSIINNDSISPVAYVDLYEDGKASGTLVSIRIKTNPD